MLLPISHSTSSPHMFLSPVLVRVSSFSFPTPTAPFRLLFAWCGTPSWDPQPDATDQETRASSAHPPRCPSALCQCCSCFSQIWRSDFKQQPAANHLNKLDSHQPKKQEFSELSVLLNCCSLEEILVFSPRILFTIAVFLFLFLMAFVSLTLKITRKLSSLIVSSPWVMN